MRVGVWGLGFKVESIPEIEHFLVLGRMLRVVVEPEFGFRVCGLGFGSLKFGVGLSV